MGSTCPADCGGHQLIQTDVSLVLYGFDESSFSDTLLTLERSTDCIRKIWILISGTAQQHGSLSLAVQDSAIYDRFEIEYRFDNLGFATGHNVLLGKAFKAGADSALVLNPDVTFEPQALASLVCYTRTYPVSLIGPTIQQMNPGAGDSDVRIDSLGIGWTPFARHYDIGQGKPWLELSRSPEFVLGVTGACMLVPQRAYEIVIGKYGHFFDDLFIAYREDAELGIRARRAGVSNIIVPVTGFFHVRSNRGFQRTNAFVNMLGVRNRFLIKWTLGRHRPGNAFMAFMRDCLVLVAALSQERSSMPGIIDAWRVRRHCRNLRTLL